MSRIPALTTQCYIPLIQIVKLAGHDHTCELTMQVTYRTHIIVQLSCIVHNATNTFSLLPRIGSDNALCCEIVTCDPLQQNKL